MVTWLASVRLPNCPPTFTLTYIFSVAGLATCAWAAPVVSTVIPAHSHTIFVVVFISSSF
jgi:hypothetical protein